MAKAKKQYVCQSCGTVHNKWGGQCTGCNEWNTLVEEAESIGSTPKGLSKGKGSVINFVSLQGERKKEPRRPTGSSELDRVTGGGLVPGSAILIGGDPGIGKSTLLLQTVAKLAKNGMSCAYISGEESVDQIRLRAERMQVSDADVDLASATSIRDIITSLESTKPDLVVIDSIQTMYVDNIDSAPGTVSQVRASSAELIRFCKKRNIIMMLVGHVTKEGAIAGPRVLEHMVDTVLYFEGDRGHQFRILRAVKNRFGATDEIGVFEMRDTGLAEVLNPSELFLSERRDNISGSAVFAGMEGTRPVLVEIQALVVPTSFGTPRRAVIGWDSSRLAMVLAVLEARGGIKLSTHDVYLNVAGGLRINEPAADLAVAAALISAAHNQPLDRDTIFFGEIGLAGEIRTVGQTPQRVKEAAKLGFEKAVMPLNTSKKKNKTPDVLIQNEMEAIYQLLGLFKTD